VAKQDNTVDLDILAEVAEVTMSRGPHAWGMAWVTREGRLRMFKQEGRIVDSLGLLAMAKDAVMLIGHCRWATHGTPENNLNNHPHPSDGGWIVHNGMIRDYQDIATRHDLHTMTECDSEVLGLLVEKSKGPVIDRCARAMRICRGNNPIVMLGLWKDSLVAAADNGQPLHVGETGKSYYLGSLHGALPGKVERFKAGDVRQFGEEVTA
jgi:glucosamine--fructose-6-phosphate aminotransferase (isomerizing)